MEIDCVKDAMLAHGDAHGDGKLRYKMEDIANVSIIHYTDMIPKEDRKPMTHGRCFEFCRTVPDMLFFGINNGRDCYCTLPGVRKLNSEISSFAFSSGVLLYSVVLLVLFSLQEISLYMYVYED